MKAFVLAVDEDKLLFESDTSGPNGEKVIGAFVPSQDGNYYKQLLIGFRERSDWQYNMSFSDWWDSLKESIKAAETLIDEEFYFDLDDVKIIEIQINMTKQV